MQADCCKPKRIVKDETVLVVVDLQERMIPAMRDGAGAVAESVKLIKGCAAIGCPIIVTQQYTKGLGESVAEIKEAIESIEQDKTKGDVPCVLQDTRNVPFCLVEKSSFSAMGDEYFREVLGGLGRKSVILCGVEAHVCILQSALDLLEAGYDVFLATDAISSRKKRDEKPAVMRMIHAGVTPVTVESALFELLDNDSKSDTFKTISRLVK